MSLWKVQTSKRFDREIRKIDSVIASRVFDYLEELELLDNPRIRGTALTGNLAGLWRYRVGDYRVLAEIIDQELIILAVGVDHRSKIYRD